MDGWMVVHLSFKARVNPGEAFQYYERKFGILKDTICSNIQSEIHCLQKRVTRNSLKIRN